MQRLFLKRKANSLQVAHPLQWLDKKNNQSGVFAQARTLMAIEQSVQELLPAGIQPYCRVTQYENGNLTLAVPNNQYASRLRQMAPSLVKGLTKKKWQINKLQLRILQTHHQSIHSPLDTGNKIIRQTSNKTKSRIEKRVAKSTKKLSPAALSAFAELKENLPEGPLANAIEQLVKNHQKPNP